jgi:hypothetical protein
MKRKDNGRITLSDEAYYKYYDHKNFISLFISSFLQSGRAIIIETGISFFIGLVCFLGIRVSYISKPREFISVVCTGMTSYSITTIGFLLVAFTMLMILNDSKSLFRYFALEDSRYKKPLIKILLSVFIIPIGVFILLLIFSMLIGFMIPVFDPQQFTYSDKEILIKIFVGFATFLFIFSIFEFLSFFHNIYKFIVITSYDMAKNFEQEVIKKEVLPGMSLDDGSDQILENIISKSKKDECDR